MAGVDAKPFAERYKAVRKNLDNVIKAHGAQLLEAAKAQADRFRRDYPEQVAATRKRLGIPAAHQ